MRNQNLLFLIGLYACAAPLQAADWMTVTADRIRRVELDRESVTAAEAGTKVAWGRIVLSDPQAKESGYKTVRALNRYDCRTRSFVIVKRVYLAADERTVRDEKVGADNAIAIRPGTVDEKFFNEVCKSASVSDLRRLAQDAATAASLATKPATEARPRRADIRLAKDEPATHTPPPTPPITKAPAAAAPAVPPPAKLPPSVVEHAQTAPNANSVTTPPTSVPASASLKSVPYVAPRAAAPRPPARTRPEVHATAATHAEGHDVHWSYEGMGGPENWGKLKPEFNLCARGTRQSPIDIREGIKVEQEPISFNYQLSHFRVVDNGHTIQVNYGGGSTLSVMGRTYELVQFHFHRPSEERVDGKAFDMVAHLVHKDPEGRLAVVAVLLERGSENAFIQNVWNNLPLERNQEFLSRQPVQMADLLPARRDYFSYMGSLTTPPCSEGVLWLVMKQPVQLSSEQIGVFSRFYANNARPIQSASGRIIKESR